MNNFFTKSRVWPFNFHPLDILFIFNLGIAFIIRWSYLFVERMCSDEALYAWCAQRIFHNPSLLFSKEIIEHHPPLFPLILSVANLFSNPEFAYRLAALIFSLLGIVTIYLLGCLLKSRFVGLVSAILLTFHYLYLSRGTTIELDVPLLVFCNFLLIILTRVNAASRLRRDMAVGIVAALIILLKWSGVIVVPFLIIYYLFLPGEVSFLKKIKRLLLPLTIVSGCILSLMVINQREMGSVFPDVSALTGLGHKAMPAGYYLANLHNILVFPSVWPLFFYGIFVLVRTNFKHRVLLLAYLALALAALSLAPVKILRYSLIVLPVMLLISSLGLEELLERMFKDAKRIELGKIFAIGFVYLICALSYPKTEMLLQRGAATSTGLKEAGEWIRAHAAAETTIISQNLRPIRYYSGINFQEFGGQLVLLPPSKKDFERLVKNTQGRIVLQVDLWSESNPSEFSPFFKVKEEEEYFKNLGFRLVKEVNREVYFQDNRRTIKPVIKIFERSSFEQAD